MSNVLTSRVVPNSKLGKEVVKINTFGTFAVNNDKIWSRMLADNSNRATFPDYNDNPVYWDMLLDDIVNELSKYNVVGLTQPLFKQYKAKLAWEVKKAYELEFIAIYFAKTKTREDFRKN